MNINEVIELKGNEGLEIDFSRIVYNAETAVGRPYRPSWFKTHITAAEITAKVNTLSHERGIVRFTEDDLETYLKSWLESYFDCGIKSFRWVWDKFRDYKAA